jgi:hypothetical protein
MDRRHNRKFCPADINKPGRGSTPLCPTTPSKLKRNSKRLEKFDSQCGELDVAPAHALVGNIDRGRICKALSRWRRPCLKEISLPMCKLDMQLAILRPVVCRRGPASFDILSRERKQPLQLETTTFCSAALFHYSSISPPGILGCKPGDQLGGTL